MPLQSAPGAVGQLDELLTELDDKIGAIFYRYRIPPQDAEDLLQDTVVAFISKAARIKTPAPWLLVTLHNLCISYWRQRRRWVLVELDAALLPDGPAGNDDPPGAADWRCDLRTAISRLPERCRRILHLRYGLGCDGAEAASRLGHREASVRQATLRCLSALARQFKAPRAKAAKR